MFFYGKKKRMLIDFAHQLADELYQHAPPEIIEQHLMGKSKSATKKYNKCLTNTARNLTIFKSNEHPGFYGKSKLFQEFSNRLLNMGYSKEIVEEINRYMLMNSQG
jgi:hypothetical protein